MALWVRQQGDVIKTESNVNADYGDALTCLTGYSNPVAAELNNQSTVVKL